MDKDFQLFLKKYFFKWFMRIAVFFLVFLAFVSPDSVAVLFMRLMSVLITFTLVKLCSIWVRWLRTPARLKVEETSD